MIRQGPWSHTIFQHVTRYPTSGNDLMWNETLGIGYLPSDGYDYGEEYWQKYQGYRDEFGHKLTQARATFMYKSGIDCDSCCDVGIGNGEFMQYVGCKGYDVNPNAVEWLKWVHSYGDPYAERFDVLTMWDVLEHIDDPGPLLARAEHVFTSLPIYADATECLASKHLRPHEHIWHFTDAGIKAFMRLHGFKFAYSDDIETRLGREGIMSYYFTKR